MVVDPSVSPPEVFTNHRLVWRIYADWRFLLNLPTVVQFNDRWHHFADTAAAGGTAPVA